MLILQNLNLPANQAKVKPGEIYPGIIVQCMTLFLINVILPDDCIGE